MVKGLEGLREELAELKAGDNRVKRGYEAIYDLIHPSLNKKERERGLLLPLSLFLIFISIIGLLLLLNRGIPVYENVYQNVDNYTIVNNKTIVNVVEVQEVINLTVEDDYNLTEGTMDYLNYILDK